jgi:hypothetical protein
VYSMIKSRKDESGKMKDTVINIRITSTEKKKLLKAFGSYANMRDFILRLVDEENNQEDGHLENYEKSNT